MTPTSIKQNKQFINDEYVTQGMILHEMRIASRRYGIPIVTITQNNRSSENVSIELSNNQVGDSVKKIRYSDNIIMIRQRPDLDIFSEDVSVDINVDNVTTVNGGDTDLLKYIIPFETKITKAKDGDKGKRQFHIFNHKNLKIYESINEAVAEHKLCVNKSNDLLNQLSIIGLGSIDQSELIFDDNNPFDNLIL